MLEWRDISLTLNSRSRSKSRKLLSHIDGNVNVGQLLGIQGPSGCGKTSLINVLTGKVVYSKSLKLEGEIRYNDLFINEVDFDKKFVCISQDDAMFSYLSVRDTLLLSARFHMVNATNIEVLAKVDATMRELGLVKVAGSMVGSTTNRGISGGEYKRVLIGKEMMKNPDIVFVDEPTSGLDAFQALAVMEAMKAVAANGRIVIAVVHQPRSSIFTLFDNLLLLSEGKSIYFGPANRVLSYFELLGYRCPEHYNPADFYLDLMALDFRSVDLEIESRIRIDFLALQWVYSRGLAWADGAEVGSDSKEEPREGHAKERDEVDMTVQPKPMTSRTPAYSTVAVGEGLHLNERVGPSIVQPVNTAAFAEPRAMAHVRKSPAAWFGDFFRLIWRAIVEIMRNYTALGIKTSTSLFFAVILSLVYHGIGFSQRNIQDRTGVLYFILINQVTLP